MAKKLLRRQAKFVIRKLRARLQGSGFYISRRVKAAAPLFRFNALTTL
jgi:hypothetical protein